MPVMLERCMELLAPALSQPESVYVDATLGLGGHAEAALARFPHIRLIGIDRDSVALEQTRLRLAPFSERISLHHLEYDDIKIALQATGCDSVHGILFDLGVSSMQLDDVERGFSYSHEAPLDMRMNADDVLSAADVVGTYSHGQLARIFHDYADEKFAGRIAQAIISHREKAPISTTTELAEIVKSAIPAATRRTGGHPAKRAFQAIRIEVNAELDILRRAIPDALDSLAPGGRIVVMSYQSLEDRIVKSEFKARVESRIPADMPFIPAGHESNFALLTRNSEKPSDAEMLENPRSTAARLRAIERLAA